MRPRGDAPGRMVGARRTAPRSAADTEPCALREPRVARRAPGSIIGGGRRQSRRPDTILRRRRRLARASRLAVLAAARCSSRRQRVTPRCARRAAGAAGEPAPRTGAWACPLHFRGVYGNELRAHMKNGKVRARGSRKGVSHGDRNGWHACFTRPTGRVVLRVPAAPGAILEWWADQGGEPTRWGNDTTRRGVSRIPHAPVPSTSRTASVWSHAASL